MKGFRREEARSVPKVRRVSGVPLFRTSLRTSFGFAPFCDESSAYTWFTIHGVSFIFSFSSCCPAPRRKHNHNGLARDSWHSLLIQNVAFNQAKLTHIPSVAEHLGMLLACLEIQPIFTTRLHITRNALALKYMYQCRP